MQPPGQNRKQPRKKPHVFLLDEPQPTRAELCLIDELDRIALEEGWSLEDLAQALCALQEGSHYGFGRSLLPDSPTQALPGSEEKVQVMTQRIKQRRSAFHPMDARLQDKKDPPLTPAREPDDD